MLEKNLYLSKMETEGKSPATIKNADRAISEFLRATGLDSENIRDLSPKHTDIYMNHLLSIGNSANSRKTKVAYVRTFIAFLYNREYVKQNVMAEVKVKAPEAKVQHISKEDMEDMIAEAKKDYDRGVDKDSYIIFKMLYQTGLRVDCELFNIRGNDITDEGLHVVGKGGKLRFVPMQDELVAEVREYYVNTRERLKTLSKKEFDKVSGGGKYVGFKDYNSYIESVNESCQWDFLFLTMVGTKRTNNSLVSKLNKYKRKCKIEGSVSAHKFRHSFAVNLLEQEVPIDVISTVMGHADVGITSRVYAKTDNKRVSQALSSINF